jgi:hypothetical protein
MESSLHTDGTSFDGKRCASPLTMNAEKNYDLEFSQVPGSARK